MKNGTKLLICIASSILIINFLVNLGAVFTQTPILYSNREILSDYQNPEVREGIITDLLEGNAVYYQDLEHNIIEFADAIGEDKPAKGMFVDVVSQVGRAMGVTDNFVNSIIGGILAGAVVYMVFINQDKALKKIIKYICILLVIALIMSICSALYLNVWNDYSWFDCIEEIGYYTTVLAVPYIATIAVMYLTNYIYQKNMAKQLNNELNKKEEIEKLDKKIGITLMVVGITIFAIVVIGLMVFNSAFQVVA